MIVILNFCNHDRDMALRQLQRIAQLGAGKKHDIVLQFSQGVRAVGGQHELVTEAEKGFASVSTNTPCTEEERGWPRSPNHGWLAAVTLVREKIMKPWFWMEPDLTILKATALDVFEAEYIRVNPEVDPKAKVKPSVRPFMGAEVVSPAGRRMSGCGMYPAKVVAFLAKKRLHDFSVREEAFDSYLASEIVPYAHFTPLLQNIHVTSRDPDVAPTFPTQESLSIIDPRAVMFHRCKDFSLVDRLMEIAACVRGLNVSARAQEPGAAATPHDRPGGSTPSAATREAEMQSEIDRLRALIKPKNTNRRTAAEQAKIDARMAKVRAARKAKATA